MLFSYVDDLFPQKLSTRRARQWQRKVNNLLLQQWLKKFLLKINNKEKLSIIYDIVLALYA